MSKFSELLKQTQPEIYAESTEAFEQLMSKEAARSKELFDSLAEFDAHPSLYDLFVQVGVAHKGSITDDESTLALRHFLLGWSACMRFGDKP